MEFRVLGPVEIRGAEGAVDVGHARQRAVLAVLLLHLGTVVPADVLIDRVWGDDPPASVRNILYGYIAKIRAAVSAAAEPGVAVPRRPGGYLLQAEPGMLDLHRFRRLVADAAAGTSTDADADAEVLLREALSMWHGPALAGLDSPWLNAMRTSFELERAAAALDLGDVRLRAGQHAAMISELIAAAAGTTRTDERLIGQLMLALYRSGRQAEALRWFDRARVGLADELGADPGPALRTLHAQILRGDPALSLPAIRTSATVPATRPGAGTTVAATRQQAPVPRELPADVAGFTGRDAELTTLDRLLPGSTGPLVGKTAVISAVAGTAGVGKTALAVHWAHRAAQYFPDGQLHVNLRGYDPAQPASAADVLASFLRALGAGNHDIPPGEDERAARYRSLIAGKRMLIVLDNAADSAQVRPLLPGSPTCAVVVTSRDSLGSLVARDGAWRVDLDVLPLTDAIALLRELLGSQVDAAPEAAATLADQCARLPLALRVAAARAGASLTSLVADLADQRRRLDLLEAGNDPHAAVRTVLSWSYDRLDTATAQTFRLVGLHPGAAFGAYATAALTGADLRQASRALDALVRAHLVQEVQPGRFGMHDLLRAYARELAASLDSEDDRRAALTRLFDHYLATAAIAMDSGYPAERHRRPRVEAPAGPAPSLAAPAAALTWLNAESVNLVAMATYAAANGWPTHATRASSLLFRHLQDRGQTAAEAAVHTAARCAARETGDRPAEAAALTALGLVSWREGRYEEAARCHRQALALSRKADDRTSQARALYNLGVVEMDQGQYAATGRHLRQALTLHRESGDRTGQAAALNVLANLAEHQGRYRQAAARCREALAIFRPAGHKTGEAVACINLGRISERLGHYEQAAEHHGQALVLFREIGNLRGEAVALTHLGVVDRRLGRYREAAGWHRRALDIYAQIADPAGEAEARNGYGEALLADGHSTSARAEHTMALRLASRIGHKQEQARAHDGLGCCHEADGDLDAAREQWQQALSRYAELGVPEAEQVRRRLAASDISTGTGTPAGRLAAFGGSPANATRDGRPGA